ncbi:MAG: protein kinase, partial [Candidatus Eremiobacteraeota bacterium]|nr:protein kinase [Candidatus Eremiobacteraeota bacterium]
SARLLEALRRQAGLRHPNIVTIYDAGERLHPYLVCEQIQSNLKTLARPVAPERALRIIEQVLAGLDYAHSEGVVHGRLHPGNVLLGPNDRVALSDFGLSGVMRQDQGDSGQDGLLPARFEIMADLGGDAGCDIFQAFDRVSGCEVTVKLLKESGDSARFERESRVMAALSHPNVVSFLEVGRYNDRPYLVSEFLDRTDLKAMTAGRDLASILEIFCGIADGLEHLHSRGIVHRDLCPQSVMAGVDGSPKVARLGTVRPLDSQTRLTEAGKILGSYAYLAPEQILSSKVTPAADIYSFGICLFEALTERLPFTGKGQFELLHAHINEPPPRLAELRPDFPGELDSLLDDLLRKKPTLRPPIGEVASRLRACFEALPARPHQHQALMAYPRGALYVSPDYQSPEAAAGQPVDGRADLHAAGLLLFELLAGSPPESAEPAALGARLEGLPQSLVGHVLRALSANPEERFASAGEMRECLLKCLDGVVSGGSMQGYFEQIEAGQVSLDEAVATSTTLSRAIDTCFKREFSILALDMAGSTRLKRPDRPLLVDSAFRDFRSLVNRVAERYDCERFGWSGDGVICLFRRPDQAVLAALDIQRELAAARYPGLDEQLLARVGVHSGEVYYDARRTLGEFASSTLDLAGHLEKECPVGQVRVSQQVADSTRELVKYRAVGTNRDNIEVFEVVTRVDEAIPEPSVEQPMVEPEPQPEPEPEPQPEQTRRERTLALAQKFDLLPFFFDETPSDPAAAARLNPERAREYRVVPVAFAGENLVVACERPGTPYERAYLEELTGYPITYVVSDGGSLDEALADYPQPTSPEPEPELPQPTPPQKKWWQLWG